MAIKKISENGVSSKPSSLKTTPKPKKAPKINPKQVTYATLRAAGMSGKEAHAIAGTNHLPPKNLTIEQTRENALKVLDITLQSQFKTLKGIRDNKRTSCNSDRIQAVKTINSMVPGWLAPQQIDVTTTGLFVELSGLATAELSELAELLHINSNGVRAINAEYEEIENVTS